MAIVAVSFLFINTGKAQNAWINEFHYDNTGTDANEFIEIVIEDEGSFTLSSFSVVLYNGASGTGVIYNTKTLSAFIVGSSYGNFTFYYYNYPTDGIQNGPNDGIALAYEGVLITGQFLSYEGVVTGGEGVANGITSTDIGVSESSSTPLGYSLQLSGSGMQYSDFTWQPPATSTPGDLNNGQSFSSGGVENPGSFNAQTASQIQIDLSWTQNGNGDDVMVAWNDSLVFGAPSGAYVADDTISGGGVVIYNGPATSFSHTGLTTGVQYFYKGWSVDGSDNYSPGAVDSAYTQFLEPSSHPNGLQAATNGPISITVSWTDSDAAHYLVKGSVSGYGSITDPTDGVAEPDAGLVKNVNASVQQHQFTGLTPNTQHYFKIFPYNGTGSATNYKTDGTVPAATATTHDLSLGLIISEVADPSDSSNAKFVEITNVGEVPVNFSNTIVYLCRQTDLGGWGSVQLTGTLNPGESHVVSYQVARFFNAYGFNAEQNSGNVSGNGNDGYYLSYGGNQSAGYVFDAYGVIGVNGTGEAWEYTNKKAVRKRAVGSPNPVWTASEWVILADTASCRDMTPDFHNGNVTWQGSSSASWNEKGSNWSSPYGYIPDASSKVTIPNANLYPLINRPAALNEVQLQGGSALGISPTGSLLIVGP